jgi:hypothetical protein
MPDEPYIDDEPESEDSLRLDNELMRRRLQSLGALGYKFDRDDPKLENEFLKYVLEFEEMREGPHVSLQSIFPDDFEFPPAVSMTEAQLAAKLDAICEILATRDIVVEPVGNLPDPVLYEYVVNEIRTLQIPLESPEGLTFHLDGCDGNCPDCFQRDYCDVKDETWEDEEPDEDA